MALRPWITPAVLAFLTAACAPSVESWVEAGAEAVGDSAVPVARAGAVRHGDSVCLVLDRLFNNDAIASKKRPRDGNFDIPDRRNGDTFPWEGMPEGGAPFAPKRVPGVTFLFPRYVDGMANNVACKGQVVRVPPECYGALYVLGASEAASQEAGIALLTVDDGDGEPGEADGPGNDGEMTGRQEPVPFRLTDWCQPAKYGETPVLRWGNRLNPDGRPDKTPCAMFVQVITLPRGAPIHGLRLPDNPRMHVFALTLHLEAPSRPAGRDPPAVGEDLSGAGPALPPGPAPTPGTGVATLVDISDRDPLQGGSPPAKGEPDRWADIGGNPYSAEYNAGFSYKDAVVRVAYSRRAPAFTGRVTASGLKPNFAYQVKLLGDRSDTRSFETIGYVGRWLIETKDRKRTNFSDREYEKRKDEPGVVIESYIFFDYFVTDGEGKATKSLNLDSTFHVTWNRKLNGRRGGPRPQDSDLVLHTFTPAGKAYWWKVRPEEATVGLWLEHEGVSPRPAKGYVWLPAGEYKAAIQLTEESFHRSSPGWARVLQGPVRFEIVPEGPEAPETPETPEAPEAPDAPEAPEAEAPSTEAPTPPPASPPPGDPPRGGDARKPQ